MTNLNKKAFVVIDLGSGRYVQTKVGHAMWNCSTAIPFEYSHKFTL